MKKKILNLMLSEMSNDYYRWYCPIKQIENCNVSPRLIESQFTVYNRQSFATKRTEASKKSNIIAKLESKRYHASSRQNPVPEQKDSKQDLDQKTVTTHKSVKFKNLKTTTTRKFRSPSPKTNCKIRKFSRCVNRYIQTERQGVLSHFTSMVDGIGTAVVDNAPWIPYVSATALAIVLFGYFSKKVEKALFLYNTANELLSKLPLNDIPLVREERDVKDSPIPETPSTNDATVNPHTLYYNKRCDNAEESPIYEPPPTVPLSLRFHYNKLKWPREPLSLRKVF